MKNIVLLGCTGSIGTSTLEVIDGNPDLFSIFLLSAKTNHNKLMKQCKKFNPKYVYLEDKTSALVLKEFCLKEKITVEVILEEEKYFELISSSSVDIVVAGIVGVAGLKPVYHAINNGKRLLLANKESYVSAGEYLNSLASEKGASIFPIDSEHSAIHQCISSSSEMHGDVSEIILTGSGGPFLNTSLSKFNKITPEEAIAHPVWSMGKKISVDSATLMNKGLELIEAKWLFDIEDDSIDLVIHPEGMVHSLVEFRDKSIIAQLSVPDMKIPIAYALGFPSRIHSGAKKLVLTDIASLTFLKPNFEKFPCLNLAKETLKLGGTAPSLLNAANEEAVHAFLENRIAFNEIPEIISYVMNKVPVGAVKDLESVLEADKIARSTARKRMKLKNGIIS